jgi:hypothetical protein
MAATVGFFLSRVAVFCSPDRVAGFVRVVDRFF